MVVAIFAVAYALLVVAIGIVPLNMLLGKLLEHGRMAGIWRDSMVQLAERTAVATAACWLTMVVTRRGRGRLTGSGMLALGAMMSGALAGAGDVGVRRLFVGQIVRAATTAPGLGVALSLGVTALVSIVVTLLLIARGTKRLA
jgi:hypothetical protein